MRTSRISRETSRFFNGISESAVTPRRSTRSTRTSLAHFTYDEDSTASKDDSTDVTYGSDIEDAIKSTTPSPPPNGGTRTASRKRKRTATTTTSGRSAPAIKTEKIETPISSPNKPPPARRVRKPARATTDPTTGAATTSPPSDWEEMYAVAKEMRLGNGAAANAAVDTMGCERLALPGASARDRRFHTLIALMLSSQTKDTVNAQAMKRLTTEMPPYEPGKEPGLNLENVLAVEPALLNDFIGKVGFHNNKTKYIKQAAEILRDHHNSDIPTTIEGLMSLPGVGPKMAHLCMAADNGWGRVEGIGVDVHVHRITNLWGWQSPPTKGPEDTRLALQSWLPHDRWKEINWLLVGLGQTVCLPVGRKCGDCELGLRGLCKAAERKKVIEGRKRREVLVKTEGNGEVVKYETVGVKAIKEEVGVKEEAVVKEEVVDDEVSSGSRASVKEEEF